MPPTTANLFDERSSRSIGIGRMVTLGSGTPLMEVFCFRRIWESVGAELFDAFTGAPFLCVSMLVVCHLTNWPASTRRLAPRRTTADLELKFVDSP